MILDMHAAPGGQTGTNIDDSYGYPWLYDSPKEQAHLMAVWQRIAKHYANNKTVMGYDLLNEPIPHYPSLQPLNEKLEPLYKKLTVGGARGGSESHTVSGWGAVGYELRVCSGRRSIRTRRIRCTSTG